jgi:hypothetical protein
MDALVNRVDDVQLVCCVHMALLGTNLLIRHESLLKKISQRMVNEISQARIKVTFMHTRLQILFELLIIMFYGFRI